MDKESKRKILGAFVVGVALVGGAYTIANFNQPTYTQPAAVTQPTVPERTAITVVDSDNNGIEDWRDDFITTEPLVINETVSNSDTYSEPTTLTGQTGVTFIQNILESRMYAENPEAEKQIIENTIDTLEIETSGLLYDTADISVIREWDEQDLKNYANIMGDSLISNSLENTEGEIAILNAVLRREQTDRITELVSIATYYETLTTEALATPVPAAFAKEHLDLINTYHALAIDINAMSKALEDPIVAMARLQKYEDNALGLRLALENMYSALLPYENLFTSDDPAVAFALFAPQQRI